MLVSLAFPIPDTMTLPTHLETTPFSFPISGNGTQLPKTEKQEYPYITFPSLPLSYYQILWTLISLIIPQIHSSIFTLTVLVHQVINTSPESSPLDNCNSLLLFPTPLQPTFY